MWRELNNNNDNNYNKTKKIRILIRSHSINTDFTSITFFRPY